MMNLPITHRNVIGNVAVLFSNSAISQGLTAFALLLTARALGARTFGQYAACFALTGILSVGFNLGLDTWLLREGARAQAKYSELVGSVFAIKILAGGIWMLLILGLARILDQQTFPPRLLILCAFSVWMDGLLLTALAAFKASLRNKFTLILESTSDGIWFAGTLLLFLAGNRAADTYVLLRVLVLVLAVLAGFLLVRLYIGMSAKMSTARYAVSATKPFAVSDFLAFASMRLDVTIVALTIGEFFVGLYSPAVSITNALYLIPNAVYLVMVPVLSKLFESDIEQAWATARRFTWALLGIGLLSFALLAIGARPLVSLLGESYRSSVPILQILSLILLFKSITFAMAGILVATGLQARRTVVQGIAVLFNAALNLIVVYRFGINGVAVVYVLTEIILLAGYFWLVQGLRNTSSPMATDLNPGQ